MRIIPTKKILNKNLLPEIVDVKNVGKKNIDNKKLGTLFSRKILLTESDRKKKDKNIKLNVNNDKKETNNKKRNNKQIFKLNENSYTRPTKLMNNISSSTSLSFYEKMKLSNRKFSDDKKNTLSKKKENKNKKESKKIIAIKIKNKTDQNKSSKKIISNRKQKENNIKLTVSERYTDKSPQFFKKISLINLNKIDPNYFQISQSARKPGFIPLTQINFSPKKNLNSNTEDSKNINHAQDLINSNVDKSQKNLLNNNSLLDSNSKNEKNYYLIQV